MTSKYSLVLGLLMTVLSCMSPEKLLNDTTVNKLYFGKFGGFTNIPMEYVLVNNKHVFKIENNKYTHHVKLSGLQRQQIMSLIDDAGIQDLQLNEPGNMTYYIRMTSATSEHEIKWTDQTQNSKVKDLYKALISTVNQ